MATAADLPCNGDGVCMVCKTKPSETETLTCKTCATPWHATCLSAPPQTLALAAHWDCPDCSLISAPNSKPVPIEAVGSDLVAAIRAIEVDETLTDQQKARKRQEVLSGGAAARDDDVMGGESGGGANEVLDLLDESMNCAFCMQLPERPVTTPCGHNFCLKCFQKWIGQGKHICAICRAHIPSKMANQPRINSALVIAIRMAKMSKSNNVEAPSKVYHYVQNQDRPDKCYTTERAKYGGKANACSGKIFVTVPKYHFGPILAENDPERNQGVLVGETWEDRYECRQWGAHRPHVAGISGQCERGAQSVALSGGYEDDEDHGEWFLYTGSGGRDLSNNKRTNTQQSFDQNFTNANEALCESCRQGYPVRVVRSDKEKGSCYAPETGVRYDGIYRVEKCWRKPGIQGFIVCRYLFVRCDNAPAPWTSDEQGDRPRPLPCIEELKDATDVTVRKVAPSWDYDEEKGCWMWKKPPPACAAQLDNNGKVPKRQSNKKAPTIQEKLLKEFSCRICRKVMNQPLTTPCAHNFCKACLEGAFAGKTFIRQTNCEGMRSLRARKNVMKCPSCTNDISDFLQSPQVNRELMGMIESLQKQINEAEAKKSSEEGDAADKKSDLVSGEDDNAEADEDFNPIADKDEEHIQNKETGVGDLQDNLVDDAGIKAAARKVTQNRKKAGASDVEKANLAKEDGEETNINFPSEVATTKGVASECKGATGDDAEKANETNDVKTKVAAKRKTSAAVKEEPKAADADADGEGGWRKSKRPKATE